MKLSMPCQYLQKVQFGHAFLDKFTRPTCFAPHLQVTNSLHTFSFNFALQYTMCNACIQQFFFLFVSTFFFDFVFCLNNYFLNIIFSLVIYYWNPSPLLNFVVVLLIINDFGDTIIIFTDKKLVISFNFVYFLLTKKKIKSRPKYSCVLNEVGPPSAGIRIPSTIPTILLLNNSDTLHN